MIPPVNTLALVSHSGSFCNVQSKRVCHTLHLEKNGVGEVNAANISRATTAADLPATSKRERETWIERKSGLLVLHIIVAQNAYFYIILL